MNILFIVEKNFLKTHVGVRRVILHYMDEAQRKGHRVELGHWEEGKILKGRMSVKVDASEGAVFHRPHWSSNRQVEGIVANSLAVEKAQVRWSSEAWDEREFDEVIITNPWLCAHGLKPMSRTTGIVYDLVPNLLSAGVINFGVHQDVYGFAHEHQIGFQYFKQNCERVTCISQSTRSDFLALFPWGRSNEDVKVDIPFKPLATAGAPKRRERSILLVNALDWRKNVNGILRVLTSVKSENATVTIVGRERISSNAAKQFMSSLVENNYQVEWHRHADDSLLQHLYMSSDVLFFPSLYEGLGLPILEAQAVGLPSLSTNISSCSEINMNGNLTMAPDDENSMIDKLRQFMAGEIMPNVLSGAALIHAQNEYLGKSAQGIFS